MHMDFLKHLEERNLISQITNPEELAEHLNEKPRAAYMGFDPTADSLHVGGLMCAMVLRRWQQAGHKVVVLIGGGTGFVGDPTGKSDLRKMLTQDEIANNIEKLKAQFSKFVDLNDPDKGVVLNNADWLMKLEYLPFLRDIGVHFSVNRMLTAECFKQRMQKDQGLTFLEFNYMLLQSYDFLELYRSQNVTLQLGGDDQWSNMLGGMELVRRVEKDKAFCLTVPLLTTSDGKKMGKTEQGAVWLDEEKTSVFDFFQYWRNVDDKDVKKCMYFMTEIDSHKIEELCAEGQNINLAKECLALEVTTIVHGKDKAEKALQTAKDLFAGKGAGTGNEPEVTVTKVEFGDGMPAADLLVASGIAPSKAEARRLIKQGGVAFNGEKIVDAAAMIGMDYFADEKGCLVKKGKKHYFRLNLV